PAAAPERAVVGAGQRGCRGGMHRSRSVAPATSERLVYPYAQLVPSEGSVQVDQPSLAGRWALVTGAGKRIGATIARTLHAAGANVAVHYFRSAEDAERVVAELNALRDGSALAVGGDIRDIE